MLKSLSYAVEFPSTGRSFRNQIEFAPGLTAIVGRNEAGKSLVIEMVEYCLFGKSALRGAAADYKNLTAELVFDVGGKTFTVRRHPKHERLLVDGEEIAVGAEAINKTMPQLLGFGLDVFNVALAAQQDELNEFTKMKPTARAKMVDDLTGMDRLEATEKECKAQAKAIGLAADALTIQIVTPVEPPKPEGFRPSVEIDAEIEALVQRQSLRDAALKVQEPQQPVEPEKPELDMSEGELHDYEIARDRLNQERLSLERQITAIPEPTVSSATLVKAQAYAEWQEECRRRGPRPNYDADTLAEWERLLMAPTEGECPKCGYEFRTHDLPITMSELRSEQNKLARWADHPFDTTLDPVVIDNLAAETIAHARAEEREALRHQLGAITVPVSRSRDLQRARDYNIAFARYDERRQRYDTDQQAFEEAQAALQTLPDLSVEISKLRDLRRDCMVFEHAIHRFEVAQEAYVRNMESISDMRREAEGYLRGAQALKLARTKGKQELTPRLSVAASALLYSLTNGERQTIVIDQDFNVWVDGQPLATLSGSGKAVVNLALRIGLGQVLTAKVLSLFIGDEIDGSMDQTRATATHATFHNLTKHLAQVMLITHKEIEADQTISL